MHAVVAVPDLKNLELSKCPIKDEEYSTLCASITDFRQEFLPTVRLHSAILAVHPATKLWYFCRAFDAPGSGVVELSPELLELLRVKHSTIYRWLREGRDLGLFRAYWFTEGNLKVFYGGLTSVCAAAGIERWGAVADEVSLEELLDHGCRRLAIAVTAKDLQQKSHYAARRQLNELERRCFEVPRAEQLLAMTNETLPKLGSRATRGVVHIGSRRIYTGRSFIPHGVSQSGIERQLTSQPTSCGFSRWTLRRHIDHLGIQKRQVVQAKPEYREIAIAASYDAGSNGKSYFGRGGADISIEQTGSPGLIRMDEPQGLTSARREGGHLINRERFNRYFQTTWLYRCNLYELSNYVLTSMKAARRKFKAKRSHWLRSQELVENSAAPLDPPMNITPGKPIGGGLPGNENKWSKKDNSQNPDGEGITPNPDQPPAIWYEAKENLELAVKNRRLSKLLPEDCPSSQPVESPTNTDKQEDSANPEGPPASWREAMEKLKEKAGQAFKLTKEQVNKGAEATRDYWRMLRGD
jgi:hypothetical protein